MRHFGDGAMDSVEYCFGERCVCKEEKGERYETLLSRKRGRDGGVEDSTGGGRDREGHGIQLIVADTSTG